MKLLITGGSGFIGSNLIEQVIDLAKVETLVNLDCLTYAGNSINLRSVEQHPKYVFAQVDLRDKAAVVDTVRSHGITHVVHLAAESHVDRSIETPGVFIDTNVVGTYNLLEACHDHWSAKLGKPIGNRRFHHVSTDEVFGSLGAAGHFSESTPYAPHSPYAASKAASDMLVRAWHHTYGLPIVITNSSNNYGPFQYPEKLIPLAIQCALERRPVPLYGDGLNVRDWLHVDDHCEALWLALTRGRDGETYCIGGNCERTNRQVVELVCDVVDELRPELGGNSRRLITAVDDRPGHDRRYAIDTRKVEREFGWRPRTEFERGLRATVQWYLASQDWMRSVCARPWRRAGD